MDDEPQIAPNDPTTSRFSEIPVEPKSWFDASTFHPLIDILSKFQSQQPQTFICIDTCAVVDFVHVENEKALSFRLWDDILSKYDALTKLGDAHFIFPQQIDRELITIFDRMRDRGFSRLEKTIDDSFNDLATLIANKSYDNLRRQDVPILRDDSRFVASIEAIDSELRAVINSLTDRRSNFHNFLKSNSFVIREGATRRTIDKAWGRVFQNHAPNKSNQQMKDSVILEELINFAEEINGKLIHQDLLLKPKHHIYFVTVDEAFYQAANIQGLKDLGIEAVRPQLQHGNVVGMPELPGQRP